MERELPFNTAVYDSLPVSIFIYEILKNDSGELEDFRIVYANEVFVRDWNTVHNDGFKDSLVIKNALFDDFTISMMKRFLTESPCAFATYLPVFDLHLHCQPISNLGSNFSGFVLTNITDYEEKENRVHFLKSIRQMKNCAVLLRKNENGLYETIFASDEFAKLMECSVEEAMKMMNGTGFIGTTHPEDRIFVRNMLRKRVADDGKTELTIRKITKKGQPIWCNVHYAFIDDFHEHYVYCTYFNVTVLKEYEERLRSVYMNLGNNFYQINEKTLGSFRVNLTRNTIEDVQGKDLFESDLYSSSYSEFLQKRAETLPIAGEKELFLESFDNNTLIFDFLDGKVQVSQFFYSKRQLGRKCFVNYTAMLTRHPMTGDVIAFITEQECNNEKVNEILLNKILVQQFDMVSYLAGDEYGVVIGDSSRIERGSIFPITRSGSYRQYLDSQVKPVLRGNAEEKEKIMNALSLETIGSQLNANGLYVVNIACDIDGETFYKRFDFYAVDASSKFYVLLKSDTTAIQREQIKRNNQLNDALQEAKQASVAKTAFLSRMSHEIRTPMNAIIGLDTIALQEPNLTPEMKEHLEKIGSSARYLLSLINDILDMSRIESGRMTLKNEDFSFSDFLDQINTLVYSQCQDRNLHYDCVIHGAVDEHYIGDSMKLKQVLINILGNAVKFTQSPGSVSLSVERTAKYESHSTLQFKIKDTGIGMDASYLPKLFEAFTQEDSSNTSTYGGSGLGMAITKNIVNMMNGNIGVESQKGKGSTFTVDITLKNSDKTDFCSSESDIRAQDLHVLVIDDDPTACRHASIVLEEIGISCDTCLSGKEALEMIQLRHARREAYNVILVDLRMPEADGVEVTRKIREIIGRESAIVILTAYSWAEVEGEAVKAGVDSFMAKPLFASNVLSELQQAIQKRKIKEEGEKKKADLTGRRILLAEDMMVNAQIMKRLLQMKKMEVEHAQNGKLAVELFASKPAGYFDVILMDIRMPVMDGLEATAAIRSLDHADAKKIPIVAMTANAFDEDVQHSLQAGMNAHLSKPVEPSHMFDTLASLIQD